MYRRPSFAALITGTLTVALASFSLGGSVAATASPVAAGLSHPSGHQPTGVHHDTETSTNWAGYADQTTAGRKFTYVVGTWTEPKVTCSASGGYPYSSFWVGIDGYSSSSVEQLGTDSDCLGKTPSYYAWWEMYPAGTEYLPTNEYPVSPGDSLTASVSVAKGLFTLSLSSSRGWRFKTVRHGAANLQQSSAEWIAEAPEVGNSTSALARFASLRFSRCGATTNYGSPTPISSANRTEHQLEMVSKHGLKLATASSLSATGNGFMLTWDHG